MSGYSLRTELDRSGTRGAIRTALAGSPSVNGPNRY